MHHTRLHINLPSTSALNRRIFLIAPQGPCQGTATIANNFGHSPFDVYSQLWTGVGS